MAAAAMAPSTGLMKKVAARNSTTKAMSIASAGIWPVRKPRSTSSWRRRSAMTPDGVALEMPVGQAHR